MHCTMHYSVHIYNLLFAHTHYIGIGIDLRGEASSTAARSNLSFDAHRVMRTLRRASFLLYQSQPFSMVISKLEVCSFILYSTVLSTKLWVQAEIKGQRLRFRADCSPHVDLGMRQDFLHLMLHTYTPLWLKIALEVCF